MKPCSASHYLWPLAPSSLISSNTDRRHRLALRITCPNCGSRPYTDFWYGGEDRPVPPIGAENLEENFERVWLRDNVSGVQSEIWYHYAGCRRWFKIKRDTRTNEVYD